MYDRISLRNVAQTYLLAANNTLAMVDNLFASSGDSSQVIVLSESPPENRIVRRVL